MTDVTAESEGGTWHARDGSTGNVAVFGPMAWVGTVALNARDISGARAVTPLSWVDDEDSLRLPASLRKLAGQLSQSGSGPLRGDEFRAVLEMFRDFLTDPETACIRRTRCEADDLPKPYDPEDVFSDGFGCPSPRAHPGLAGSHADAGILSIVAALFSLPAAAHGRPPAPELLDEPDEAEEGAPAPEPEPVELPTPGSRPGTSARLLKAVAAVSEALLHPPQGFERSPRALGVDIALTAVLLTKGLADGLLGHSDFRNVTRTLWASLFFGKPGTPGRLPEMMRRAADAAEREALAKAFVDQRLSAALALWSMAEWHADDAEAAWFRLSAALLHQRYSWLFAGARPDEMVAEIELMASAILPNGRAEQAVRAWAEVVRSGEALRATSAALSVWSADELRSCLRAPAVGPGELVWVQVSAAGSGPEGHLGFNQYAVRREAAAKATVVLLGGLGTKIYKANALVSVSEVAGTGVLMLTEGVAEMVLSLAGSASACVIPI